MPTTKTTTQKTLLNETKTVRKASMKTRQLGTSNLHITPIGFGAWAIGGGGWEFAWGAQDDRDSVAAIREALESARHSDRTTAIVIPVDREQRVGGYESWWDVPVAEISTIDAVQTARAEYVRSRAAERTYL